VLWKGLNVRSGRARRGRPRRRAPGVLLVAGGLLALAGAAGAQPAARADSLLRAAGPDDLPVRDLGTGDLAERDGWFFRGLRSLFARRDPAADAAAGERTRLARAPFEPFAGDTVRSVLVFGRKAFGDLAPARSDTGGSGLGGLVSQVGTVGRALNSLAPQTRTGVIRDHLLVAAGDVVDPDALADSERLLRELPFIQDARLQLFRLLPQEGGGVAVIVLVRDRWPWGARADVKTADRWEAALFHRNVGGLGLDLESQLLVARDQEPSTGWVARAGARNLAGSFIDLQGELRRAWDRDLTRLAAARRFVYPDIRLVGGWSVTDRTEYERDDLPPGAALRTRTGEAWFGWGVNVGHGGADTRRRTRLIPAVGVTRRDYRDPPRDLVDAPRRWRDHTRGLLQLNLADVDYYTANLVSGYGETEDIPAGLWAALTGGYEVGERQDRWYHGGRVVWPRITASGRYLALSASYGGFRRAGRFEDGVLDLALSGFGNLHRAGPGHWRHFLWLRYTLGVNQSGEPLRLDRAGLRDLDDPDVAGTQRLVAAGESVLFSPYAVFGFRAAAFGYLAAGMVAERKDPLLRQRLHADVGLGLRLNNPGLVVPTIELRAGLLTGRGDPDPVLTVRMGDVSLFSRRLPSARPAVLPYR
jgi:hypothetical protein